MKSLNDYIDMWNAIQNALSHGGYVKVRNGEMCCDGDHILLGIPDERGEVKKEHGILRWNKHDMMFDIHTDDFVIPALKALWIEKDKEKWK